MITKIEKFLETFMFSARWLLAPFYIGMVIAIALLLIMFFKEMSHLFHLALAPGDGNLIVGILGLIDIVFVANLLIIIIFAGYENFVSKIDTGGHEDRPSWMGHVDFSDLKLKLIGSIVAISGIELLKTFVTLDQMTDRQLAWKVGIHVTFVFSGVMFAVMDKISAKPHGKSSH
ncbi:MAG: TIGR00645 family protein [Gammaproteobacteria bacterium]|nr:TIGR00645 family protein [Gammaproteobacteria bacterium]